MHLSVALQDEIWGTVGGSKFCWRSSAACALLAKPLLVVGRKHAATL